jgi:hypothetical protein
VSIILNNDGGFYGKRSVPARGISKKFKNHARPRILSGESCLNKGIEILLQH